MPSGLLSTILDTTGERLKERIEQSQQMDKEMRDTQTSALINSIQAVDENGQPRLSPAEMNDAWERISKLHSHNKPAKDIITKAQDIFSKIHGSAGGSNPAMAQRAGQQTTDALSGGQGGSLVPGQPPAATPPTPGSGPMSEQTPIGGSSTQPPTLPVPPAKTSQPQVAPAAAGPTPPPARSTASLIAAGSPGRQTQATTIATQNAQADKAALIAKKQREEQLDYETQLDERRRATRRKEGEELGLKGVQLAQYMQGSGSIATKPFNFPTAQGGEAVISLANANGIPAVDASNEPIDKNAFYNIRDTGTGPAGVVITKETPDYGGIAQWAVNQDHHWIQYQRDRKGHYPIKIEKDLGLTPPQGLGFETAREVPMVDNQGNTVMVPAYSTRKPAGVVPPGTAGPTSSAPAGPVTSPVTPPVTGAAPAATPEAAATPPAAGATTPPVTGGAAPPAPPVRQSQTAPAAPKGWAPNSAGRVIHGALPEQEVKRQTAFAMPLRDLSVELFGDPKNPDFKGLADYAYLMDSKDSRDKIGEAFRQIVEGTERAGITPEDIGASMGGFGGHASTGGLWTLIKNYTGITNKLTQSELAPIEQATSNLSKPENEMLTRMLAVYEAASGMRTITKGGAYKFSVEQIQNTIPIPGKNNVISAASFHDKVASMAESLARASEDNRINDDVLPEKAEWRKRAQEETRLAHGGLAAPPQRGSTPNADDYGPVEDIVVDGKPIKARQNKKTGKWKPE